MGHAAQENEDEDDGPLQDVDSDDDIFTSITEPLSLRHRGGIGSQDQIQISRPIS